MFDERGTGCTIPDYQDTRASGSGFESFAIWQAGSFDIMMRDCRMKGPYCTPSSSANFCRNGGSFPFLERQYQADCHLFFKMKVPF